MTAQTIYTDTETGEVINFPVPKEEKAELRFTGDCLRLTMSELIFLWDDGLLNAQAYCTLALKFDGIGAEGLEDFDIQEFCDRWVGPPNDKEKCKRLSDKDVLNCLDKLQKAGKAEIERTVQLKLKW